jgi:3-hydroxyacyl-[acyl-carrier-protein] dehydratase
LKNRQQSAPMHLGSNVIEVLLPFRRPLNMVDAVVAYERNPVPRLRSYRCITANEPVFDGHFPGLHLWPGIYTQEGLGQSGAILAMIVGMQETWEAKGGDPEEVLEALRNLERGFTMHPGYRPKDHEKLLEELGAGRYLGLSASVNLKFLNPVFAGQRVDYEVVLVKRMDKLLRMEVEATVAGKTIVRGIMTGSFAPHITRPDAGSREA